jgi:DNA replication protein DnaC
MVTLQLSKWIDTLVLDMTGFKDSLTGIIDGTMGWGGILMGSLILGVLLGWGLYLGWTWYQQAQTYTITIYTQPDIAKMNEYFKLYPQAMTLTSLDIGSGYDIDIRTSAGDLIIPKVPTPFEIDQVRGLIHVGYHQREITVDIVSSSNTVTDVKTRREYLPYVVVTLKTERIHAHTFLTLFREKVAEYNTEQSRKEISLHGSQIKTLDKGKIEWLTSSILKCPRSDYNPEQYLEDWFYRNRARMFRSLQSALARGDSWNIIAHGPPGTGKSSLGMVIAKHLGRHLISVNLAYLNRPQILEVLFGGNGRYAFTEAVFVLEELDFALERIEANEAELKNNHILIDGKPVRPPPDINTLRTKDLLEIFQGPIPRPGLIIVATTNDLESIRKRLPALIRPGRLTPWKIDLIGADVLAQIVTRYFGSSIHDPIDLPSDHGLPTSQIVEYAKSSLGDYAQFKALMEDAIHESRAGPGC